MRKRIIALLSICAVATSLYAQPYGAKSELRAPAYPLITIDPYTSCWSPADYLYDTQTAHWSGQAMPLIGAIRVDGSVYRFMGTPSPTEPVNKSDDGRRYLSTTARQLSVDLQATRTIYLFECGAVELTLTFMAPLFLDDLELISRPVNYISYSVRSMDGKAHNTQIYFEATPAWASNNLMQSNSSSGYEKDGMLFLKTGTDDQRVLERKGDQIRIDWGYFYICADNTTSHYAVGDFSALRSEFTLSGRLSGDVKSKNSANIALSRDMGSNRSASGVIMIGYDDIYSIKYFGTNLRPYWNRKGDRTIEQLFGSAAQEYTKLEKRCAEFDRQLMENASKAGGREYAELCAAAYRQAISAHKLVEAPNGDLLFLSKENASNGSIGTVDITYPSSPMFLYYNPEIAKALMNHIFYYSESGKWDKPFPAHDVGTYPHAMGQTYKHDMPIEESGNMLILSAAIVAAEGNAGYVKKHWKMLTQWAEYLVENGLDPENQLNTDDFAGHSAHNANLSVKAIMGIASYGYCARAQGLETEAKRYFSIAREMARKWMEMADDGDHYRLTFDKPDSWSQKYNLVWDKILGLDIFPPEVARKEVAYYLTKQNRYGLPLDSRRLWTKSDWVVWTATLAEDNDTFRSFVSPVWSFMNETYGRVPMSDWYKTDVPEHVIFKARSVVGGYWMKMLEGRYIDNTK